MTRALAGLLLTPLLLAESIDLSSPELIADGSELFAKNCAVGYCHGSEGRSARGPALRDRVWVPEDLYRITADGLPGTSMPGWNSILTEPSIWAVTAYVLSLSSDPPSGEAALVTLDGSGGSDERAVLSQEAQHGKDLFFDLRRQRRCGICHAVDGMGTAIGPNLALAAANRTDEELRQDITSPSARIAYGFEQVELELRSGERVAGVLAEETDTVIRVYDTASAPPPLRSVPKGRVRQQRPRERSSMPGDLDTVYSAEEITAIVAFLREAGS